MNLAQLEAEIFSLPIQDRALLAKRLLLSLEEISNRNLTAYGVMYSRIVLPNLMQAGYRPLPVRKWQKKYVSIEDFIIYVYCCVEAVCRQLVKTPLRSRGFQPKLTDGEVITMEIAGEFIGKDQDKSVWRYLHNHWHSWFPHLSSRSNYVKQSASLCG